MAAAGRQLAQVKFDINLGKQAFYDLLLEISSAA